MSTVQLANVHVCILNTVRSLQKQFYNLVYFSSKFYCLGHTVFLQWYMDLQFKKCFDAIKLRTRNRINLEILDSYEHILKLERNYHLTI
jgi:hypothetical protein